METLMIGLMIALLKGLPEMIEAIKKSTTMTEEEKQAAYAALSGELRVTAAAVAAVKFRDV